MGKLVPIILIIVGLGSGVGAGLFLRPITEETEMAECSEGSTEHEAAASEHMEEPTNAHGATVDGHGASADTHDAPEEPAEMTECVEHEEEHAVEDSGGHGEEVTGLQYAKLSKQFVVPVISDGRVSSLVVISLSIEVDAALLNTIFTMEPKLRDAFLTVMFLHANSGGFDGEFTRGEPMNDLRGSLREAAQDILGHAVTDVLITEIVRQDM